MIGLCLVFVAVELIHGIGPGHIFTQGAGHDYSVYMDAARRWLAGGGFYQPNQLAGPYVIQDREILYPPVVLALLVPFTVLPAFLWWAIPITLTAWIVVGHRPSSLGWAAIAVLIVLPVPFAVNASWSLLFLATGNPGLWTVAAVATATRWGWSGALVIFKPSLLPFAFIGSKTRGWWITLALMAAISVAMLPLTLQYVAVLLNARGPMASLLYSVNNVPLMLIPVAARVTGRRTDPLRRGLGQLAVASRGGDPSGAWQPKRPEHRHPSRERKRGPVAPGHPRDDRHEHDGDILE